MAPNPSENQKDVGQFNAWLHNIGQTKVPQRPQPDGPQTSASPRYAPRPPVPSGGGILGEVDSEIDDVFGRIVSDGPGAPPPSAPMAAAPRPAAPAPQAPPPRPEPPKAPPSRADVDRLIAAAQAQLRPPAAPPQRPAMPAAPQAAPAQPQSIFGRPVAPAPPAPQQQAAPAPWRAAPQPAPAAPGFEIPTAPAAPALAGADASNQAQLAQIQQTHQQELARVENSFLETKNQLQKQVKDIQLKYQEQRSKWENVLADLRIRNDELLRRNQELEQQVEQMTERHRQLIQEYADMRGQASAAGTPSPAPLPEEIGVPQGQLLKGEFEIPAIAVPGPEAGGFNIEPPLPDQGQPQLEGATAVQPAPGPGPARIAPEISFQIPAEPPSPAEDDDLLAELEALEKEMKDIGENDPMPELPEVETIRRDLAREIRRKRIKRVEVLNGGSVAGTTPGRFAAALRGRMFTGFGRRAKYLFMRLGTDQTLVVHLKMTGVLLYQASRDPLPRAARIIFHFGSGGRLVFSDLRKFGFMRLAADPWALPAIRRLGPEPLDEGFTADRLSMILGRRTGPIRAVLLDQNAVAGLGNIYALESLHRAGISPKRKACGLKKTETVKLHRAIRAVLRQAIAARGSSVDTYRDGRGRTGWFQVKHRVYGREGKKCLKCKALIVKEQFRGRGTYWCPECQR